MLPKNYNIESSIYQQKRVKSNLNPSFVKNFQRAVSLKSLKSPRQSMNSQHLSPFQASLQSPILSPNLKSFNSSSKLPALPTLSSTVKSTRSHGIVKAYCANTHKGLYRNSNEDRVMIISKIPKPDSKKLEKWPSCSYFAVFDGNLGKECSVYLRDHLHTLIITDQEFPNNPQQAIFNGFSKAEQEFCARATENNIKSGSCAVVAIFISKTCYLAHLGNSRAVLSESQTQKITQVSNEHFPNDPSEKLRIEKSGGSIVITRQFEAGKYFEYRVLPGSLTVSRAIGHIDSKVREFGGIEGAIIAVPEIRVFRIHSDSDFLFLGSDGVFEHLENNEIVNTVWQTSKETEGEVSEKITKSVEKIIVEAMIRNSPDNLTAIVIIFSNFFKKLAEGGEDFGNNLDKILE